MSWVTGNATPEVIQTTLSQFERATADLADLIEHVSGFVNWWAEVNTTLANLEMVLPQIKVNGTNPFRTDTVKERWVQVYQNYVSYQRQVCLYYLCLRCLCSHRQTQISETEDYYKDISGEGPRQLEMKRTNTSASPLFTLVDRDPSLILAARRWPSWSFGGARKRWWEIRSFDRWNTDSSTRGEEANSKEKLVPSISDGHAGTKEPEVSIVY